MKAKKIDMQAGNFVACKKGKIKDFYNFHAKLGSGGYSKVYLASHKISKEKRCVKVIDKS